MPYIQDDSRVECDEDDGGVHLQQGKCRVVVVVVVVVGLGDLI